MKTPETGAELEALKRRCGTATRLWGRTFSGLTAMTFREKGEAALHRVWHDVLTEPPGRALSRRTGEAWHRQGPARGRRREVSLLHEPHRGPLLC